MEQPLSINSSITCNPIVSSDPWNFLKSNYEDIPEYFLILLVVSVVRLKCYYYILTNTNDLRIQVALGVFCFARKIGDFGRTDYVIRSKKGRFYSIFKLVFRSINANFHISAYFQNILFCIIKLMCIVFVTRNITKNSILKNC